MEYHWRLGEAKEGRGAARPSSIIPCVIVQLIDYVMVCTLCSFPFQTWYHPRSAYFLCCKYHQGFGPTRRTVKQHTDGWMDGWMDEISIQLDCEWNQQHNNGWMDGWNLNITWLWMKPTTQQSMDGWMNEWMNEWMKFQYNLVVDETNNTAINGWMKPHYNSIVDETHQN